MQAGVLNPQHPKKILQELCHGDDHHDTILAEVKNENDIESEMLTVFQNISFRKTSYICVLLFLS
jgi:hypothetical protein